MPRANRHFLPGYVWHLTHRCHKREFLLKFSKDKQCWLDWLFEARKRFQLCVLNYVATSNHIHLLVYDNREGVIPKSIQLAAGRTAQEYNQRKGRKGAFWEDRYHATAVQDDSHLIQCLVYIDLNMVRAGAVAHPSDWNFGGYTEIQQPRKRYSLIDRKKLMELLGIPDSDQLTFYHSEWIEEALRNGSNIRDEKWTESVAVGSQEFVEAAREKLGARVRGRNICSDGGSSVLKETQTPYTALFIPEKACLRPENSYKWDIY